MHLVVDAAIYPRKFREESACGRVLLIDKGDPTRSRRMAVPANERSNCPAPEAGPARHRRYSNIRYPVETASFRTPGTADQDDGQAVLDANKLDAVLGVQGMIEPRLVERPQRLVELLILEPALDP